LGLALVQTATKHILFAIFHEKSNRQLLLSGLNSTPNQPTNLNNNKQQQQQQLHKDNQ